ncbi:MAG: hypothetical protein ACD_30C00005G0023 [uncultured bacterium]|uniref:GIY-YIG domain-containing protein n=3 Tax=Candidatus Daviesiibacteriota TaxID=1752718 RepID=A0A1F5K1H3_9BACT|nr:MAG: hypothetical protein ACD_30C00005G0023 [uncultured bacterium]KKQ14899.1 MAG: polymerase III, epsilon subunit protein [Candidatus Daviesbacteria bacterium GW2011_GWA1_36_8]OGE16650.1 MAG: hypothetical protein A2858_02290 [Candidatus Daviesbacteria bacterium RIFCSPHIGHO2_01_FULL_36_37]OGE33381.1 MAG: hypothetical protein A3C99_01680 [Candidatus Daviesbacteria bacterium RIFCSPHIGHO2_02_FULL_37_9]OGE34726.1 MAG: hypothetical protein A3E66_03810 [Candidatus Daviesbacteria bacterium RIFCSPHIG
MDDLPKKLAFVDIETTGCRISDRIIEIGILRVENHKLIESYQTLLNPQCHIPEEIVELTGITPSQLEAAPTFYEVKKDIYSLLEDCIFVAHNVRFDLSFLKNEFKRWEISFSPKQICTVKLSRALYPEHRHHNLDSIIERFKFKVKNRHRAFDDAKVLWDFYSHLTKKLPKETLLLNLKKAMKRPSIPIKISEDILDSLPKSPGVYIFYGENRAPLYVGKSINIKDRVMSHFSSDHLSSKELKIAQLITNIETIQTFGELGALLLESTLVKKLQPLYNSKLRLSRKLLLLKVKDNPQGYKTIALESVDRINPADLDSIVGVFRSKKQAKDTLLIICKNFNLCEKLLSLENTKGECFGYRLGNCHGACKGKEKTIKYNLRFIEAFTRSRLKPWPFNGPIIIKEGDEGFLLNNWCLIGKVTMDGLEQEEYINFDLDTYKILSSYLNSQKKLTNIESPPNIKLKYLNSNLITNPF